jgi:hypothetical protein
VKTVTSTKNHPPDEQEQLEKVSREIAPLLSDAVALLNDTVASTRAAFEHIQILLDEINVLARKFNRCDARTWCLPDTFRVAFDRRLLDSLRLATIDPKTAAPVEGVRVKLHALYRDFPRDAVVVVPRTEARKLLLDQVSATVVPDVD